MSEKTNYIIKIEPKYAGLELINVPLIVSACKDKWFNQTLCKVNGSLLRLGVFEGEFHWHKHDTEDEVFFVLEGSLVIETEKGSFILNKQQGICVPAKVLHRPVAKEKAIVLMVENDTIKPIGD